MQAIKIYYTGKRAKTGSLCSDLRGRLQVFITYCDECHAKVMCDLREAEDISRKWGSEKRRNHYLMSKLNKLRQ